MKQLVFVSFLSFIFLASLVQATDSPPNETFSLEQKRELYPKSVSMFLFKDVYYAVIGTDPSELYASNDGNVWNKVTGTIPLHIVYSFTQDSSGNFYIAGKNINEVDGKVYKSADSGQTWTQMGSTFIGSQELKAEVVGVGDEIYAWSRTALYRWNGNSWSQVNILGFEPLDVMDSGLLHEKYLVSNTPTQTRFSLLSTNAEVGRLPNTDKAEFKYGWARRHIIEYENVFYLIAERSNGYYGSIWASSDFTTWQKVHEISGDTFITISGKDGHGIYAVTNYGKIYKSWDGINWRLFSSNQNNGYDVLFIDKHSALFGLGTRIYKSTSNAWPTIGASYQINNQQALPGQSANVGDQIRLLGIGFNPENDGALSFSWTQTSGSTISLTGSSTSASTFTLTQAGTYAFKLAIKDSFMSPSETGSTAIVSFNVTSPNANPPVIANAATDNFCFINQNCTIVPTLEDPDGLEQVAALVHTNPDDAPFGGNPNIQRLTEKVFQPSRTPSVFVINATGNFIFTIEAYDGANQVFKNITVTVTDNSENQPPVANAGEDKQVEVNKTITLEGTGSDPENLPLKYYWAAVSGPPTTGSALDWISKNTSTPTFIPKLVGVYTITFVVTDNIGQQARDNVTVTVFSPGQVVENLEVLCGNHVCDQNEDESSCPEDCKKAEADENIDEEKVGGENEIKGKKSSSDKENPVQKEKPETIQGEFNSIIPLIIIMIVVLIVAIGLVFWKAGYSIQKKK